MLTASLQQLSDTSSQRFVGAHDQADFAAVCVLVGAALQLHLQLLDSIAACSPAGPADSHI
jgi:hypothetical protein